MNRFINREWEIKTLEDQYAFAGSSFVVLYGRRRVGKTALIREFIKDKPALYFPAAEESDAENRKDFAHKLAEFAGNKRHGNVVYDNWYDLAEVFKEHQTEAKKVLVIDEFPYLVSALPAFPSILQKIWDTSLMHENIMLILCGSLIHMMEKHALNYSSPLYGRRTCQIKLKQMEFQHYSEFFDEMPYRALVERYAVTGGVPRYIELFEGKESIFDEIGKHILDRNSLLYEEPEFLLRHEVDEVGSYFSIIKSIAAGNRRAGKISADIGIKQTSLPKYLKTLIDLDILEREVPITETNPEKSKTSLYKIKDNFIRFWFRFVYPERARLEMRQTDFVLEKIKANFVDNHVALIYEDVCLSHLWSLNQRRVLNFNKLGRWWNSKEEIDIVGFDSAGTDIVFAECKYSKTPIDIGVFYELLRKKDLVPWNNINRRERFVLFSIGGFTERLSALSREREDLILYSAPEGRR